jgi:5'-nucleotidase
MPDMKTLRVFAPLALFLALACNPSAPAPRTAPPAAAASISDAPVHVVIVSTTDVHGWFDGRTDTLKDGTVLRSGGLPLFASYVKALRAANDGHVVLVDSGDLFQGTLESNLFEGEPVVKAYNELGYAAAAVGNHEFDFGPVGPHSVAREANEDPLGALKHNASLAHFPFLSANLKEKSSGQTPSWCKRSIIVETGGVRIGIVGLSTPDTPNVTTPANVAALTFGDPVAATVTEAADLRARGADAVIVIAHMGGRCTDVNDVHDVQSCESEQEAMRFLHALPGGTIDAYFAGHTHAQMREIIEGVPVTQALAYSREFGTLDLWIQPHAHRVALDRTNLRPLTEICDTVWSGTERCGTKAPANGATLVPRSFESQTIVRDPQLTATLQGYLEKVAAKRNEPLHIRTAGRFRRAYSNESELGDLLADSLREAMHTDVAFVNAGGIRADLRAGDLVYGDIFEVSPFDNYPAVVRLTGAQLAEVLRLTTTGDRGVLQPSGIHYTVDLAKDADKPAAQKNRVVAITMADGTPLDPAKTYSVAMPDFLAVGGDGLMAVMRDVPPGDVSISYEHGAMREVLIPALQHRAATGPLQPKTDKRLVMLNGKPERND